MDQWQQVRRFYLNDYYPLIPYSLEENALYAVVNLDDSSATELSGSELMDTGLPIAIKDQPGDVLITYKKI